MAAFTLPEAPKKGISRGPKKRSVGISTFVSAAARASRLVPVVWSMERFWGSPDSGLNASALPERSFGFFERYRTRFYSDLA